MEKPPFLRKGWFCYMCGTMRFYRPVEVGCASMGGVSIGWATWVRAAIATTALSLIERVTAQPGLIASNVLDEPLNVTLAFGAMVKVMLSCVCESSVTGCMPTVRWIVMLPVPEPVGAWKAVTVPSAVLFT